VSDANLNNDLAKLSGQPDQLTIDGRTFDLYPLTLGDLGALQAWLNSHVPDPFDALKGRVEHLDVDVRKYLYDKAMQEARTPRHVRFESAEGLSLLFSPEGLKRLLHLRIKHGDPGFTIEKAGELCDRVPVNALARLRENVYSSLEGDGDGGAEGDGAGPKAGSTGGPSTATS
jgi:hypothetical protein